MSDNIMQSKALFAERDAVTQRLAEIDRQLVQLRLDFMRKEGLCGLNPHTFRSEINRKSS